MIDDKNIIKRLVSNNYFTKEYTKYVLCWQFIIFCWL